MLNKGIKIWHRIKENQIKDCKVDEQGKAIFQVEMLINKRTELKWLKEEEINGISELKKYMGRKGYTRKDNKWEKTQKTITIKKPVKKIIKN